MDFFSSQNPSMDITARIAATLTAWMHDNPNLNTLKKLSEKSKVGFGTIRRAKNGDGNITVKNLALIAKAFNQPVEALIGIAATTTGGAVVAFPTREPEPLSYRIAALIEIAKEMSDDGQSVLIGRAQELRLQYPKAKIKPCQLILFPELPRGGRLNTKNKINN